MVRAIRLLFLVSLAGMAWAQTNICHELSVPILTVTGDEADEKGALQRVKGRWERTPDKSPLRVALADNEPGGTGEAFSTAAWNAAITAGLLRNDLLQGVRITLDINGGYDGPSAGAVMCLAFMAALDGRRLPDDFGMTGSVSPEGSVGSVGGVAEKVRAAAAAGLKRFAIPALVRFEDRAGEKAPAPDYVDLAQLGARLGVTIRRVRTIVEAYAFALGLPDTNRVDAVVDARAARALPAAFEQACRARVLASETARRPRQARAKGKARGGSGRGNKTVRVEDLFTGWARDSIAADLFTEDWPYLAWREAVFSDQAAAFLRELKTLRTLASTNVSAQVAALKLPMPPPEGYRRSGPEESELAAQLVGVPRILAGCAEDLVRFADADEADADGDEEIAADAKAVREKRESDLRLLALQRFHAWRLKEEPSMRAELGRTLARRPVRGNPRAVAHFLYAAWKAVYRDFETDAVAELGRTSGDSVESVLTQLAEDDRAVIFVHAFLDVASEDMALLDGALPGRRAVEPDYHAVAAACIQAETLGLVCGLRFKYSVEGSTGVGAAVRRARAAALADLARCQRAGVPCPAAVAAFSRAERALGGSEVDVACDVLGNYLATSFLARALMWLFA